MTDPLSLADPAADIGSDAMSTPGSAPVALLEEFAEIGAEREGPVRAGIDADADPIDELQAVFDVPVRIQAVLGRARMSIGELMRLRAGMIIDLDRKVGEPVDIFVNDRLIARGEVVLIDDLLGVTLTEIVQPER